MDIKRPVSKQPIPDYAKCVFEGVIFDVYQWEQEMFDGSVAIFERAYRKADTVGVIPITDKGKIILTKQSQPGRRPFVGVIAGRVDSGEDPWEAAVRELREESGIEGAELSLWFSENNVPKTDWAVFMFFARGWNKQEGQRLDLGEKIELIEVTFDEYVNEIIYIVDYRDDEIALYILKLKKYPKKMEELRRLFLG